MSQRLRWKLLFSVWMITGGAKEKRFDRTYRQRERESTSRTSSSRCEAKSAKNREPKRELKVLKDSTWYTKKKRKKSIRVVDELLWWVPKKRERELDGCLLLPSPLSLLLRLNAFQQGSRITTTVSHPWVVSNRDVRASSERRREGEKKREAIQCDTKTSESLRKREREKQKKSTWRSKGASLFFCLLLFLSFFLPASRDKLYQFPVLKQTQDKQTKPLQQQTTSCCFPWRTKNSSKRKRRGGKRTPILHKSAGFKSFYLSSYRACCSFFISFFLW